jgi:hypothetical protein
MTFALVDGHESSLDDNDLLLLTETAVKLMDNVLDVILEEKHRWFSALFHGIEQN